MGPASTVEGLCIKIMSFWCETGEGLDSKWSGVFAFLFLINVLRKRITSWLAVFCSWENKTLNRFVFYFCSFLSLRKRKNFLLPWSRNCTWIWFKRKVVIIHFPSRGKAHGVHAFSKRKFGYIFLSKQKRFAGIILCRLWFQWKQDGFVRGDGCVLIQPRRTTTRGKKKKLISKPSRKIISNQDIQNEFPRKKEFGLNEDSYRLK